MKYLIIVSTIILSGCSSMTNEQFISECNKCKTAGYECGKVINSWTHKIVRVVCDEGNPDIKECVSRGGIPIKSAWDGRLKDCKGLIYKAQKGYCWGAN